MHACRALILPILVLTALTAVTPASAHAASRPVPLILVICSYHADYPWQTSYRAGLEEVLGGRAELRYFDMDTKRLPERAHAASAGRAWETYLALKPDMVILGDDAALKHIGPRLAGTGTPCVYLGINANPRSYTHGASNITGILERPLFMRNMLFIREIIGERFKKGLILFDTDITSKVIWEEQFHGRESMTMAGIRMELKMIGELDDWKRTVEKAGKDGYDIILLGLYHTIFDKAGKHVDSEEMLRWTSANTPLPLFCFWDFSVGPRGAIGGLVLFGQVQGRMAAETALRILAGETPSSIYPVMAEKGRFLFSRAQLARWGLALPEDIASQAEFTD